MLFQEIYLAIKEMQNFCVFVCVCVYVARPFVSAEVIL